MSRGLVIEVNDQITGYCPACVNQSIEFRCMSISGNSVCMIHKYVLYCLHQDVCVLRRGYMESDEIKEVENV